VKPELHISQKQAALKKLIQWARTICNADSLDEKIDQLKSAFRQNGYDHLTIKHAPVLKQRSQIQMEKPAGTVTILFQQAVSHKMSRLPAKHIKTIHIPLNKKNHTLTN
jgi:uncharacterized protein (DUF302 family)